MSLSPSYSSFFLKVLTELLPSLSLILVYLGLTLPSLFVTMYCLNRILCPISPCCQNWFLVFFSHAIICKILSLLWLDYHKHTCFFSLWGHWANTSICMRKFFLLERLRSAVELYLGSGSCSWAFFGAVNSARVSSWWLCQQSDLQWFSWIFWVHSSPALQKGTPHKQSFPHAGSLDLSQRGQPRSNQLTVLGRLPSSGICSKQLIALDPFRKRLCRHVFPQWTTGDGGTLPEEPAAFGIRWLERSPFSLFKTKSLFNICCREFSWLRVPRETVLFLLFPVSLLIKVIFLPFPHLLCFHICFLLDRCGAGGVFFSSQFNGF